MSNNERKSVAASGKGTFWYCCSNWIAIIVPIELFLLLYLHWCCCFKCIIDIGFTSTLSSSQFTFPCILATGEPPLHLAVSVVLAVRRALQASRLETGLNGWWRLGQKFSLAKISFWVLSNWSIGAWKCNLENHDIPTDRPTNQRTDRRGHKEVTPPIIRTQYFSNKCFWSCR